ncbi:MAG: hypothetical protein N2036_11115 [Bryobacteraceae bacterium]|nr:hypothetical protein [Bryobacteraceae bacterium]
MRELSSAKSCLSLFVSVWLVLQPAAARPAALEEQERLRIVIVEGDQALFNVRQRVAREAIIQVEDENRRPVAGALLTLTAPREGASVVFANGLNNVTLATDEMGRAVVRGIRPNQVQGSFRIRITAVKDGMKGSAEMQVSNAAVAAGSSAVSAKFLTILAAAGAAAAGIALAARTGDGPQSSPAIPTTPGSGRR